MSWNLKTNWNNIISLEFLVSNPITGETVSLSLWVLLVVGELRVSELYVQEQFINRFVLYFRIFSTATSTFDTADIRILCYHCLGSDTGTG